MTVQYNVNIVGNLVNSSGVLSGFSSNDYATITTPITFGTTWEINTKIHTGNDVSGLQVILCPNVDQEGVRIEFTNGVWGLLCGHNGNWVNTNDYQGGTVAANTTYWLKAMCNGAGDYSLKVSTDGITYTTAVSYWGGNDVTSNFTSYIIGIYSDFSQGIYGGSIDLTKSNIISDGLYIWRGVLNSTVGTKIQLRHDTAANWTLVNPVLLEGEVGIETDTRKQKFGDGVTAWNSLAYDKGSTALQSITSSDVTTALGYTPVNKAGDTMTGTLNISTDNTFNENLNLKNTNVTANSVPSTNSFTWLAFKDTNNASVGGMYLRDTTTAREVRLRVDSFNGNNNNLVLGYNTSNTFYSELPSCDWNNSIVTTVSKSKSQNGYYKLGNGLIIQWGKVNPTSSTSGSVTLPTAFTSTNYSVTATSTSNATLLVIGTLSTTGFDWGKSSTPGSDPGFYWIAIGY